MLELEFTQYLLTTCDNNLVIDYFTRFHKSIPATIFGLCATASIICVKTLEATERLVEIVKLSWYW